MKIRSLRKPRVRLPRTKTTLVLLTAVVLMDTLAIFLFTRLDNVVHGDLYRYGLQFSYEWTGQYWTYSRLMMNFLAVSIIVTGISMAAFLVHERNRDPGSRLISCVLLIVGLALTTISAFFFNRLDFVVHNDLYRFGLQFSYEWAMPYWTYAKLILASLGLASATSIASAALILASPRTHMTWVFPTARTKIKIDPTKLFCFILFSTGVVALGFSINYTSSILAFIGLGLVFWAAILFYIRPDRYVKETLLDKATVPLLANLEKLLKEFGFRSKGVYLPPKYLKDLESSLVFIPSEAEQKLPAEEVDEEKLYLKNPNGIFLTPPGLALSKLFEKELATSFLRTDLNYLQERLPKLLVEDLEIAESIEIKTQENTITAEITNHIFNEICSETRKLQNIHESVGCPLCSAIACALAKATGKPVRIEKEEQSRDKKTTRIYYSLQED